MASVTHSTLHQASNQWLPQLFLAFLLARPFLLTVFSGNRSATSSVLMTCSNRIWIYLSIYLLFSKEGNTAVGVHRTILPFLPPSYSWLIHPTLFCLLDSTHENLIPSASILWLRSLYIPRLSATFFFSQVRLVFNFSASLPFMC